MFYEIERTEKEINDMLEHCDNLLENPKTSIPRCTQAEAIKDAISWLTNKDYDNPLD